MREEGISPLRTIRCSVFPKRLTPSPAWGGASPINHPRGCPQSPKATKNTTKITRFCLPTCFMGKEENSLLKTIIRNVFLICPTLSPSCGGASPIRHPRGPPQSFRATKNTTELSKFGLLILFTGNVGNRPLKTIKC